MKKYALTLLVVLITTGMVTASDSKIGAGKILYTCDFPSAQVKFYRGKGVVDREKTYIINSELSISKTSKLKDKKLSIKNILRTNEINNEKILSRLSKYSQNKLMAIKRRPHIEFSKSKRIVHNQKNLDDFAVVLFSPSKDFYTHKSILSIDYLDKGEKKGLLESGTCVRFADRVRYAVNDVNDAANKN